MVSTPDTESIEWNYGVVACLDILGFSNLVEEDSVSSSPKHLDRIITSLRDAKKADWDEKLNVRAFSDSIIISAELTSPAVQSLLHAVGRLQRTFLLKGILIRGGIAFGKHYSDVELIYSQALINAYKIERDIARFSRVLVDSNLLDWFWNDINTTKEIRSQVDELLLRDRDNYIFLNYLEKDDIENHLNVLQSYSGKKVTPSVLEKIQWLASYHNYRAEYFGLQSLIDGTTVVPFTMV